MAGKKLIEPIIVSYDRDNKDTFLTESQNYGIIVCYLNLLDTFIPQWTAWVLLAYANSDNKTNKYWLYKQQSQNNRSTSH